TQGLEEANLQGGFLGQRYVLDFERDTGVPPMGAERSSEGNGLPAPLAVARKVKNPKRRA
ncbi:MAG: hypothetical protein L0177_04105, partial [Chloroflexi bacterium]|nr:hypothetical protein [Chloroflexota bacterium]